MSESAKLTYFDLKGLGESIRLLLTMCKIKFEDYRLDPYGSEWPKVKEEAPLGQLPFLDIDGMRLSQSRAICRYLAKKIKLDGDNDKETVYIDIAADIIYDFMMKMRVLRDIDNESARQKKLQELHKSFIPRYFGAMDDMVRNNGGYFANGKLSWVDLMFAGAHDYFSQMVGFKIIDNYPNLKTLIDTVHSIPDLQEYLKFRPNTEI